MLCVVAIQTDEDRTHKDRAGARRRGRRCDDYELFDYIEDVLTERGLQSEFTRDEERDGGRVFIIHFRSDVSTESIAGILGEISSGAVERIWRLNH